MTDFIRKRLFSSAFAKNVVPAELNAKGDYSTVLESREYIEKNREEVGGNTKENRYDVDMFP